MYMYENFAIIVEAGMIAIALLLVLILVFLDSIRTELSKQRKAIEKLESLKGLKVNEE